MTHLLPTLTLPAPLDTWPTGALVALGLYTVVALALLITGVVAWLRTPDEAMPSPNRWVWLALLFVQIAGPIAFLILRRRAAEDTRARHELAQRDPHTQPTTQATHSVSTQDAVDLLYGGRDD